MKKEIGSTRVVYVFDRVVIKVARIYLYKAIRCKVDWLRDELWMMKKGLKAYIARKKELQLGRSQLRESKISDHTEMENLLHLKLPMTKMYECWSTASFYLLNGIMANLQERRCYRKTKNVFAMPTYFSFFGLINIQKKGEKITFWLDRDVWLYLLANAEDRRQCSCDTHALSGIQNYRLDEGRLKLVDYGDRRVQPFLEINGKKLFENFKPDSTPPVMFF